MATTVPAPAPLSAVSMAARLPATSSRSAPARRADRAPAIVWARMTAGSSERGLSSVMMVRSLPRAAAAPISGRLSGSRSPPQPSTVTMRPWPASDSSAAPTACGVCAKSTTTSGASAPRSTRCIRPGTWASRSPASAASADTPTASSIANATAASIMLYSPGSVSSSGRDSPALVRVARPPSGARAS